MITPENKIPIDDQQFSDADDQQSQKDIHSNGLEGTLKENEGEDEPNTTMLKQAYEAAEPAHTLNLDNKKKEED